MSYAEGVSPFRDIAKETPTPNAYTHLKGLNQETTCHIAEAADLCIMLTKGLDQSRGVYKQAGQVSDASWSEVSTLATKIYTPLIFNSQVVGVSISPQQTRRFLSLLL
jgi:alpha-1,3/alpha-1,6-mannosyltransferase